MSNKLLKATPLITAVLLLTILAAPVFAQSGGGGHLWFYSQDPDTLPGPQPLPNPQDYDPNYLGPDPDGWLLESVVVPGDWETPFSIWLGCAQFQSYDTCLVISINDAAFAAIDKITVEGWLFLGPWKTNPADFPLPPHGISNSAEWYGFATFTMLGDLFSPPGTPYAIEINIDIDLVPGADVSEAKIHFDAYGWTTEQHDPAPATADMRNPFSHDLTFVVPEAATMFALGSSLLALGTYAYKRKKQ